VNMWNRLRMCMVIGSAVLLASAFGQASLAETVLRYGSDASSIGTLDPFFANKSHNATVSSAIFEGLVEFDLSDPTFQTFVPLLATNWEFAEDGLSVIFSVRQGVHFQHGYGEMTAEDVAYSWIALLTLTHLSTQVSSQHTKMLRCLIRIGSV